MAVKVEAVTQSGNIKAAVEAFPARLRRTHPQHTAAAAAPAALQTGSTLSPLSPDDGDSRPVSPSAEALIGLTSKREARKPEASEEEVCLSCRVSSSMELLASSRPPHRFCHVILLGTPFRRPPS